MVEKYTVGLVFEEGYPPEAAVWCNANGAHIEAQNGAYVIVENTPPSDPTEKERVAELEAQTGLTRAVRELVLAEGSGASEYLKNKAAEMEELAACLRKGAV